MDKLKEKKEGKQIKDHKIEKNRVKKRRLKPEVKLFLFFASVSFLIILILFMFFFKIENVFVQECEKYSQQEIVNASGIKQGSSLLLLNKKRVQNLIQSQFSYIEKAEIIKKLPNSVEIKLKLEEVDFAYEKNGEFLLVSKNNRLLEKSLVPFDNTLEIKGIELEISDNNQTITYKNPEDFEKIEEIRHYIQNIFGNKINIIDISDFSKIILHYRSQIRIIIGDASDLSYKLLTAKEIIDSKIDECGAGRLDVSEVSGSNTSYFMPD